MKDELDKILVKEFPNLYRDRHGKMQDTCMCWGFECGDGWFEIIKELSAKLEPLDVVALQVKEKFGGLRFYIGAAPEEAFKYIDEAESLSYKTCENCGAPDAKARGGGWVRTLCEACADKRK